MYYSLLGRDLEHELVPFCADAGIGVMVWSPLAGGFLSGKYTRAKPKGESGDRLAGFEFLPYDRERAYELIDLLRSIGAKHGAVARANVARVAAHAAGGVVGARSAPRASKQLRRTSGRRM